MKAAFSNRFVRQYAALTPERKAKFDKQLRFLLTNPRHPSLRVKKYDEVSGIWQAGWMTITAFISESSRHLLDSFCYSPPEIGLPDSEQFEEMPQSRRHTESEDPCQSFSRKVPNAKGSVAYFPFTEKASRTLPGLPIQKP